MKIAIYTLGCKLNYAETEEIKDSLKQQGFVLVNWTEPADFYIINACSVTLLAEKKTEEIVKNAEKNGKIILTGCLNNKNINPNYIYIPNKNEIALTIKQLTNQNIFNQETQTLTTLKNRTRAFIKIQSGCDNFCSYCLIPYLRGQPISRPYQEIKDRINLKLNQGYQEFILTGVNIAKYNNDNLNLTLLIKKLLQETAIKRIRLGSLDPHLLDTEFIELFQDPRLCRHWHLSLQSGSNKILKLMNRHYTKEEFKNLIDKIKKVQPLISITTDVIVGFPNETESDFQETFKFCQEIEFSKIHVFPYSPREKTNAFKNFKDNINTTIKKERADKLRQLSQKLEQNFKEKNLDQAVSVLLEMEKNGFWWGHSDNYLKIRLKSQENLKNKITKLTLQNNNVLF